MTQAVTQTARPRRVMGKGWTMFLGDCVEVMAEWHEQVDHVITDPPYSEHVHTKSRAGSRPLKMGNGKPSFNREAEFGFGHLEARVRRACARHFGRLARRWVMAFSDEESSWLWRLSWKASGLEHVRHCTWVKEGCTPQFTGDRPATATEAINLAHRPGRKRWNGGGKRGLYTHPVVQKRGATVSERVHTTQKPIELMLDLVRDFTDPDDEVLDPFAGSGTTGVACLRLGRRFVGVEKDPKYFEIACARLKAEEEGSTLAAATAGQTALFGIERP